MAAAVLELMLQAQRRSLFSCNLPLKLPIKEGEYFQAASLHVRYFGTEQAVMSLDPNITIYRKFARLCRSVAATLADPEKKRTVQLMAAKWDQRADLGEITAQQPDLHVAEQQQRPQPDDPGRSAASTSRSPRAPCRDSGWRWLQ
jgi:hypothetical protein